MCSHQPAPTHDLAQTWDMTEGRDGRSEVKCGGSVCGEGRRRGAHAEQAQRHAEMDRVIVLARRGDTCTSNRDQTGSFWTRGSALHGGRAAESARAACAHLRGREVGDACLPATDRGGARRPCRVGPHPLLPVTARVVALFARPMRGWLPPWCASNRAGSGGLAPPPANVEGSKTTAPEAAWAPGAG